MMKLTLLRKLTCLTLLATMASAVHATDWNTKTDTIWAGRHYREKGNLATGNQEYKGPTSWKFEDGSTMVFVLHMPDGHVRADALLTPVSSRTVTLNVRVLFPKTNTVISDLTVKSESGKGAAQRLEIMPDTELAQDGWYRVEITSPDASNSLSQFNCLLFQRTSRLAVTDANSMMAPAVHLWWSSTDPDSPSDESCDWIYTEAMIPEALKQSCTYQMTLGSTGLYSGIQTNHLLNEDTWTHAVIFSAWDAGDVDQNKNLPDYLRSGAVDVGPEAYAVRFGGEGTGASLRYPEGQRWQTDHWVQMIMNERPDYMETVSTDENGQQVTTPARSTLLSLWYKQAEETEWHYFGTIRAAATYRMEGNHSGMYSFLENWSGFGGDLYRRVYYRNGAMRSTASGKWYSLNHAGFGSTQHWETQRNSRDDYGHGVTSLYDNSFYIETGGQLGVRDSADTYEPCRQGEMPWVDTIDIQALRERVDLALLRNNNKDVTMQLEATRVVSNPDTWTLYDFSDEETTNEGDYGRAAQIMDGNTSTYYRNRYWSQFPHIFFFDAGEPVTVSAIGLYQGQDFHYRAKDMQLHVSDDGKEWKGLGRLKFENDDAPTVELSEPVTARYFRCRFLNGHGNDLAINEIYFKHEYRLADLKQLAERLLAREDCFSGFRPADLTELKQIYADGTVTDADALRAAIARLGQTAQPLNWGSVDKLAHLTSFSAYQIHNMAGLGDLVADETGQLTVRGATTETATTAAKQPTRVSALSDNWLILRSDAYGEYYFYHLGTQKYLTIADGQVTLSDTPSNINLTFRGNGFMLGRRAAHVCTNAATDPSVTCGSKVDDTAIFQLRNNYVTGPTDTEIRALLTECEEYLHGGTGIQHLLNPAYSAMTHPGIVVYNIQGSEVYHGQQANMPALPAGVYIMQSGNGGTKKVIVK
ncbi:MAG: DUF3472 domain-containing protein [Bacteroidaceae bacterium]|nr:DUF3472 domain-containing protein [Bacteroidaceae bacterium]